MVFFWRGAGILVLVFFFLAGWITSYWFEDTRFGNGLFMGWSMIWASVPCAILWLVLRGWPQAEPAPGEVPTKTIHSFMFIPVVAWPVILLAGGIYFVTSSGPESTPDYTAETIVPELEGERIINFWNPTEDSLEVITTYATSNEQRMKETIKSHNIIYATYAADRYIVEYNNIRSQLKVTGANNKNENDYQEAWFVLNDKIDLILLDVTQACTDTINRTELASINWMDLIVERYKGGGLIEPRLTAKDKNEKLLVIDPGFDLPLSRENSERVYSLIPIESSIKSSDSYLDSMVINLCY